MNSAIKCKRLELTLSEMSKADLVVILHETVWESWLKDIGTFGGIGLLSWLNHSILGGSWVIDLFVVAVVLLKLLGSETGYKLTVEELHEVVENSKRLTR